MLIKLAKKILHDNYDYKNAKYLGDGASGKAFEVYDKNTKKIVVFKEINKKRTTEKNVLLEVTILRHLNHLHVNSVLSMIDFFECDVSYYIITEYSGSYHSLYEYVQRSHIFK